MSELVVTRVFDATPQQIWDVWTDPDQLYKFFAPGGSSVPRDTLTMDVRVGGEFSLTMVNDVSGEEYPMQAEYVTLDEPAKLSFKTTGGIQGTIELEDLGMGKTLLTWTTEVDFGDGDDFRRNATIGTHSAADNLGRLLESLV